MKIAIIYSTSSGITKKAAKILSNKIKAKIQLIPIEKAKTACLLKYDFIILAGSLYHGKVQGTLKRYISRNMGTLMEKPVALFMNCDEKSNTKSHLNKTFSEQLVKSSFISSNFGYEINPDEGNFIDKIKAKKGMGISLETTLVSICCMGIGITPLNIGEMSYVAACAIMERYQEKENYHIDIDTLLAGGDSKKIKPQYWIRNLD